MSYADDIVQFLNNYRTMLVDKQHYRVEDLNAFKNAYYKALSNVTEQAKKIIKADLSYYSVERLKEIRDNFHVWLGVKLPEDSKIHQAVEYIDKYLKDKGL